MSIGPWKMFLKNSQNLGLYIGHKKIKNPTLSIIPWKKIKETKIVHWSLKNVKKTRIVYWLFKKKNKIKTSGLSTGNLKKIKKKQRILYCPWKNIFKKFMSLKNKNKKFQDCLLVLETIKTLGFYLSLTKYF